MLISSSVEVLEGKRNDISSVIPCTAMNSNKGSYGYCILGEVVKLVGQ